MKKLSALKYYKVRSSLDIHYPPEIQKQMDAAKAAGVGDFMPRPTVQEYVNPDLRRSTTPQRMPAMARTAGGALALEAKVVTVVRAPAGAAPKLAMYVDCAECEQGQDQAIHEQLRRQAAATARGLVSEVVSGLMAGPLGVAGTLLSVAQVSANQAAIRAASEKMKDNLSLNRWTCRDLDLPAQPSTGEAGAQRQQQEQQPVFRGVEYLGERQVGDESARAYQVRTDDGSEKGAPMIVYTSMKTGLPLRMERPMELGQGMSGGMTMEYYDFDVPIRIDLPDCLK
jgi:hypothetical protein